jgi:single-strand DNA-binding protein
MAGINKVILIGNLGDDPDSRETSNGTAFCKLRIATSRSYTKQGSNERVEETEWHQVTVWGKTAEFCAQYLAKGRQVYVEGRLQTRSYEDKDGIKRYSTDVVAETVQFLGGRGGGEEALGDRGGGQERRSSGGHGKGQERGSSGGKPKGGRQAPPSDDHYESNPEDDDIPFD